MPLRMIRSRYSPTRSTNPGCSASTGANTSPCSNTAQARSLAVEHRCSTAKDLAWAVFEHGDVFAPVLAEQPGFVDRVGEYLDLIIRSGIRVATAEAARASSQH